MNFKFNTHGRSDILQVCNRLQDKFEINNNYIFPKPETKPNENENHKIPLDQYSTFQSDKPIPKAVKRYYFEMQYHLEGYGVYVGLAEKDYDKNKAVGSKDNSFSYNSYGSLLT